jgi:hypothetical protein
VAGRQESLFCLHVGYIRRMYHKVGGPWGVGTVHKWGNEVRYYMRIQYIPIVKLVSIDWIT